ncbi:hypothetical protein GCM10007094_15550 [Pseudovibrio japonicus]|uniref:DUF805 domain-containing protein n=1 Tax=Pseudovibrio japonicus TaxID=366534 RepID=A0ABQ3E712_9HYPH|nr:hypothetical protein [Pseudovibrio japonicus]GHB27990.1 hypothetical protein GCM10007094_15550 [Pseudovibrio japonicus]
MMDQQMMMESFALWQLAVMILWIIIVVIPVSKILHRIGFSRIWAILAFIPLINLVFLWILAYIEWPVDDKA